MAKRRLVELAHARSGDKGDRVNIGLIAKRPEDYPLLLTNALCRWRTNNNPRKVRVEQRRTYRELL